MKRIQRNIPYTRTLIMKLFVILACTALVAAAPQQELSASNPQEVKILRFDSENNGLGTYSYAFEQSDGTKKEEQGELKNAGTDDEFVIARGSYSWTGSDGIIYTVTYVADENGFHPTIEQAPGGSVPAGVIAALRSQ